jgi:hypothetical protein
MNEMRFTFDYDYQMQNLDDVVGKRYLAFCSAMRKFPKTIGVPLVNAGYSNPLLKTKIDRSLAPGLFWLSVELQP